MHKFKQARKIGWVNQNQHFEEVVFGNEFGGEYELIELNGNEISRLNQQLSELFDQQKVKASMKISNYMIEREKEFVNLERFENPQIILRGGRKMVSNGIIKNDKDGMMPLLGQQLVVVEELRILGLTDKEQFKKILEENVNEIVNIGAVQLGP